MNQYELSRSSAHAREPATVALIEDDPSVRRALGRLLLTFGIAVRSFESAEEFLSQGHTNAYPCIILDIQLPGMSGLELYTQLASVPTTSSFIFISALARAPALVHSVTGGSGVLLHKPLEECELRRALSSFLISCSP